MINAYRNLVTLVAIVAILSSCKQDKSSISDRPTGPALFDLMDNKQVGIDFINTIVDRPDFNVYLYRNYYNGGGVAIGDINNDGLQDVYMVSNQQKNKLYLNKGNWKFEDITERAGVGGNRVGPRE
jgi:enediyne biosynthesis protein E4